MINTGLHSSLRKVVIMLLFFALILSLGVGFSAKKQKEKFYTWQEVAIAMSKLFDQAIESVEKADLNDDSYKTLYREAYENINKAYFGYYEVQGFEKNVMVHISRDRVNQIEGQFANIKHALLENEEKTKLEILSSIEQLKMRVYKDAMVLDNVAKKSDPDEVGAKIFGKSGPKYLKDEAVSEEDLSTTEEVVPVQVDPNDRKWASFGTSFGLLLREGLEALLVVVAIISYLIKTKNGHMVKNVWYGVIAAVIASIILAIIIETILGGVGVANELIEGWTMFIAVIVLFYVGNWMLHKSDTEAFQNYVDEKVQKSIDEKSMKTLIFAVFIAVFREGAELILFYKATFSSGVSSPLYVAYGMVAAIAVLVFIYIAYRYMSIKIPLKPFFVATSILFFLMCISFMGKGVIELTEGNVISGRTVIPSMNGFSIGILNIYDRAETLIPQIMLFIASAYLTVKQMLSSKKRQKAKKAN